MSTVEKIVGWMPGFGHLAKSGYWHPGRQEGCPKCESPSLTWREKHVHSWWKEQQTGHEHCALCGAERWEA